ncbi:MAG: phosphopantetheine-binding protein [Sinobacteraceae bacterium]|nr:phosphopantetheine-binding protein [Nevskiaceae bacterium]
MTEAEKDLAALLIEALQLEDKHVDEIDPEQALFGDYESSWGLDSIDALEIALAVQQKYGVEMRAEEESTRQAFTSLRTLHAYIEAQRTA